MKSEVRHPDGPPSRPKQIVELILTPAEFGALYLFCSCVYGWRTCLFHLVV